MNNKTKTFFRCNLFLLAFCGQEKINQYFEANNLGFFIKEIIQNRTILFISYKIIITRKIYSNRMALNKEVRCNFYRDTRTNLDDPQESALSPNIAFDFR